MKIGPHISQTSPRTYPCFQTFWGSPKSLQLKFDPRQLPGHDSTWIIHASYLANITSDICHDYLRVLLRQAAVLKVYAVVVHLGTTKKLDADEVIYRLKSILNNFKFIDEGVILAIENPANSCPFNWTSANLARTVEPYEGIGWCLDTHHAFAAGIPFEELHETIQQYPPSVVHANFPGSPFGSGIDKHGCAYLPDIYTTPKQREQWYQTLRLLKDVPMILECSGDVQSELAHIKGILE